MAAKRKRATGKTAKAATKRPAKARPRGPVARLPPRKPGEARFWLVKSEPDVFSVDDFLAEPERTTAWNGVRNFAARNHMKDMRRGDRVLVYHSNAAPSAIVGVAEVVREAYPDPTQFDAGDEMSFDAKSKREDPTWVVVDLRLVEKLARPVALDEVKATRELRDMALVRISRLSVQPVTPAEFDVVLALAKAR